MQSSVGWGGVVLAELVWGGDPASISSTLGGHRAAFNRYVWFQIVFGQYQANPAEGGGGVVVGGGRRRRPAIKKNKQETQGMPVLRFVANKFGNSVTSDPR